MKLTKRKTQFLLKTAVCLALLFSSQIKASDLHTDGVDVPLDATLPSELYQLPENQNTPLNNDPDERFVGMKKMLRAIDTYFEVDTQALDKVPTTPDDPNPPSDLVKWRLTRLTTEIAVSIRGIIAPLALKGTASMKVLFKKKEPKPIDVTPMEAAQATDPERTEPALHLTEEMTRAEMNEQLEPLISMVIKTKKVADPKLFRDSLLQEASEFYQLAQVLADDPGTPWWVSRFRLDLWVAASGKVQPTVSVGGEFKLRFEWFRLKPNDRGMRPQMAVLRSEREKNFKEFVEAMTYDAQKVSFDAFQNTGFYPNYLKMGIGMTATGSFGLVKFGGGLCGYLYLSTVAKEPTDWNRVHPIPAAATKPILLMERNPPQQHLVYARENNIPFEVTESYDESRGIIKDIIYQIDRARFRAGLGRATQMATHIAQRAQAKGNGKRWGIYEIRPGFELSIGGDFKLVSVNGFLNLEMSIYNGHF